MMVQIPGVQAMPKRKPITDALRRAVQESGMTHYRLGKLANTRPQVIDKFMTGLDIRLETAERLAAVLGLELREVNR
jgi:predicted transcriptional regulator